MNVDSLTFKFSGIDVEYDNYFSISEVFENILELEYAYNYYVEKEESNDDIMNLYFFLKVFKQICFKQLLEVACNESKNK